MLASSLAAAPLSYNVALHFYSKKELDILATSTKTLVQHTIQYLYLVIRDGETSDDYTIQNLQDPKVNDKKTQSALQTSTGKFLSKLVNSASIFTLFSNYEEPHNETLSEKLPHQMALEEIAGMDNLFIEGDTVRPYILTYVLKSKNDPGLYAPFLTNEPLITSFIEVHGLVIELANFSLICEKFYKIVDHNGEILIYGIMNDLIKNFIQSYFTLVRSLFDTLINIHQVTQKTYLTHRNNKSSWLENYQKASDIYENLEDGRNIGDRYAIKILQKIIQGSNSDRQKEIEIAIKTVVDSAIHFLNRNVSRQTASER